MERKHFVSVIVVNYNGRKLLDECLRSLRKIDYPKHMYEVIMVDNNSSDDSVSFVHHNFPEVYLVRNEKNLGFVGGNRVGLTYANGEYIVLLNTDTKVDPRWLSELVRAAENPKVGIVNSKLFYATPFLELTLRSTTIERSEMDGSGNFSPLGILLEDILCARPDLTEQVWYADGFYKRESNEFLCRWTKGEAKILVPYDQYLEQNQYKITVRGPLVEKRSGAQFSLWLGKQKLEEGTLTANQIKQFTLTIEPKTASKKLTWLVQNAGNVVFSDGYGRDRGSVIWRDRNETKEFYERDSEYFDRPTQLLAFCGASCLIKRKVIEDVGFFDEKYYMYYEDLDVSLKSWLAGWNIVYEPKSIVYHKHKASTNSIKGAFMLQHVEKNHLYFLLTYFPIKTVLHEFMLLLFRLLINYVYMVVYIFRNNLPKYELLLQRHDARKKAVFDFIQNIPYFLSKRGLVKYKRPNAHRLLAERMY